VPGSKGPGRAARARGASRSPRIGEHGRAAPRTRTGFLGAVAGRVKSPKRLRAVANGIGGLRRVAGRRRNNARGVHVDFTRAHEVRLADASPRAPRPSHHEPRRARSSALSRRMSSASSRPWAHLDLCELRVRESDGSSGYSTAAPRSPCPSLPRATPSCALVRGTSRAPRARRPDRAARDVGSPRGSPSRGGPGSVLVAAERGKVRWSVRNSERIKGARWRRSLAK
jgi:hypothetical protein